MKRYLILASLAISAFASACTPQNSGGFNTTGAQPPTPAKGNTSGRSPDLVAFFDAVVANDLESYRSFISAYPDSPYSWMAQDLMTQCASGTCATEEQIQAALGDAASAARRQADNNTTEIADAAGAAAAISGSAAAGVIGSQAAANAAAASAANEPSTGSDNY